MNLGSVLKVTVFPIILIEKLFVCVFVPVLPGEKYRFCLT